MCYHMHAPAAIVHEYWAMLFSCWGLPPLADTIHATHLLARSWCLNLYRASHGGCDSMCLPLSCQVYQALRERVPVPPHDRPP